MSNTPNLSLQLIAAQQAQKHITVNDALARLDALAQIVVKTISLTAPPASPEAGERHIVANAPTGLWAGQAQKIAWYDQDTWMFITPQTGWIAYVSAIGQTRVWNGTAWVSLIETSALNTSLRLARLGVGTDPDPAQRLVVASAACLFTHEGSDHRLAVNKANAVSTASVIFQNGFSGRAEFGLSGDDDFRVKVSPDGTSWINALGVDRSTGRVSMPATPVVRHAGLVVNGDFSINQRVFAGGALGAGAYGFDRWKAGTAGASVTVASGAVTLTSGTVVQVIDPATWGLPSFASTPVTISVEDNNAPLRIRFGTAVAVLPAGTGRRGVTLTPGATGGPLNLELETVSGAVTFRRLKLEPGAVFSDWLFVHTNEALALCQNYFCKSYPVNIAPGTISTAGQISHRDAGLTTQEKNFLNFRYPVPMRATPNITWYSPQTGLANRIWHFTAATDRVVDSTLSTSSVTSGHPRFLVGIGDINHYWFAHIALDAEL
jgi:Protein of unknown function (DUF2793)